MYSDDRETVAITPNGQQGAIDSYTIWNAATNYSFGDTGWTVFATVKNIGDKTYVADMARGIIPGPPRWCRPASATPSAPAADSRQMDCRRARGH